MMWYHEKVELGMRMWRLRIFDVALVVALLRCVYVPFLTVRAQPGFISIDCGLNTAQYTDSNNITWVPDTGYTFTGQNYDFVASDTKTFQSLRYFPEDRSKDCYVLPAIPSNTYMVRVNFLFADFLGTDARPPMFYLEIDAVAIDLISFTATSISSGIYYEVYLSATRDTIYVCLARVTGVPFISSLELRALDTVTMYRIVQQGLFLKNIYHANFGSTTPIIRYPYDVYDRQWQSDTLILNPNSNFPISTNTLVNVSSLGNMVPELVMQSADSWPQGQGLNLTTSGIIPPMSNTNCYVLFYFAEIDPLARNETRVFDLILNQGPSQISYFNISVVSLSGGMYIASELVFNVTSNNALTIQLLPHPDSHLGPILNALELFVLTLPAPNRTLVSDALAIESLKEAFNLTSWLGDPCVCTPYDWITCTNDTFPRIKTLKLSNYNLTGIIPGAALRNLTALTELWLDHNSLDGPIPNLSNLTNLQSLRLQNNNITGDIPVWLASLPSLQELLLSSNNLTGTVPSALLSNRNLTLHPSVSYSLDFGNPQLCNVTSGCPPPSMGNGQNNSTHRNNNVPAVVGGVVAGMFMVVTVVLIYNFCHKHSTRSRGGSVFRKHPGGPNIAQEYSFAEVIAMTNKFNQILGEGGFGTVCYGKLPNGQEVAVKRLSGNSQQGAQEFYNEVDLLSRVHHKNLVALVGYCQEGKEQILIYEYMPSGTVRENLYGTAKACNNLISWNTRLEIALNAAEGLEYLHTGCVSSIIHRDIKTSNILLSANMTAKVADFELSKAVVNEGVSHVSTVVKGTTGYLDPEYYTTHQLTDKRDVFSFGVVLLELICGQPPLDTTLDDRKEWYIAERVKPHIEARAINNIVDKAMEDNYMLESIWKVAEIAVMSIAPFGINRPTMRQVVSGLREAIEIQTNMQSSSDISSVSMQSNACFAPTIAKPTTTAVARNNNNHIQGSSPLAQCMSSSSETNHLQTNFQASSSNPIMDIPYAK
ncbi:unnamed protein product [Sphagnum jensenii]|uniref:non-specific serine/threonine protein kinase n=1 Tax=Sphagnum jensenii TaxID=128206 RepID=A0ABP0VZV2_9BRYO